MLNGWNIITAELKKHIQLLHFINKTSKEIVRLSVKMLNGIGKAITKMDESDMPRNPTDKAFHGPINRFNSPINYQDKGSTEIGYRNLETVINQGLTRRQINLLAGSRDEQSALPCSAHFKESTGRTPYLPAFCLRIFSPYYLIFCPIESMKIS
ncbi:MAG: hypothetical protein CVU06_07720 [Bacteroidetes bacterium HGW-Bacteroidetes-22]|nr:MAG: hypothetical protein CVU06_07720 [Bacteroidetes bacterium HGW-Bacteroidetes-22]